VTNPRFLRWRRAFCLAFLAIAVAADLPAANSPARSQTPSNPEFQALPLLRSRQNHLLVRAIINGKEAWLGVDSGAPVSAISLQRRAHFRLTGIPTSSTLPSRLQINGGFNSVAIAHHFRLGGLDLLDEPVVTVDLGSSSRRARLLEEQQIDGILGADILFPTKAVLDCQRQLLIMKLDPNLPGRAAGVDYRGFSAVPIQVSDGFNLYVNASINGTPAKLMVDTGAFATLLHRSFVRQMRIPLRETPYSSAAVNLKQRGVQLARIRKLSVGSIDIFGKAARGTNSPQIAAGYASGGWVTRGGDSGPAPRHHRFWHTHALSKKITQRGDRSAAYPLKREALTEQYPVPN